MGGDDSRSVRQLTDYEKSIVEALREERRRKLGIAAAAPAATLARTPPEPPPQDAQPAESAPIHLAQSRQDAQPGRPAAVSLRQDPVKPVPDPPAQPAPHGGSRLRLILLGSLLIVILAGAAIVVLKPDRILREAPAKAAGAIAQPDQPVQKNLDTIADRIDETADRTGNDAYEVTGDRVRLRSAPAQTGSVLRTLRQGTFVSMKERPAEGEWCQIQLAGGREGWMKCDFLKAAVQSASGPTPQETRKK